MSVLDGKIDSYKRMVDELAVLSRQSTEIEHKKVEKRVEILERRKELEKAILAYWADNGNLNGTCFKTAEFDIEDNNLFFQVIDGGRKDGNNRQIYLVEYFYRNEEVECKMGRYGVEWRPIETIDLSPKNIISIEEYKKEMEIYKGKWEKLINGNDQKSF